MKPLLVLGLGNRLMMDDGIGVAVVEALAGQDPPDGRIHYAVGETDFAYCLDLAADCERLLVVDAVVMGRRPGDVAVLPLRELAARGRGLSMHDLHLIDLLLHGKSAQQGALIGIEPFHIDLCYGLSAALSEQFEAILGKVRTAIENEQ